jgi:hypothetical protein
MAVSALLQEIPGQLWPHKTFPLIPKQPSLFLDASTKFLNPF